MHIFQTAKEVDIFYISLQSLISHKLQCSQIADILKYKNPKQKRGK